MITKRWCTECGEVWDAAFWNLRTGEHLGCGGKIIPIATICNPPEPTVIEASDMAPGMVVTTVDDGTLFPGDDPHWIMSPDVRFSENGLAIAKNGCAMSSATPDFVRHIAGPRRP